MTEKLSTRNPGPIAKKLLALESFRTNGKLKGVAKPDWFDHGKISVRDFNFLLGDRNYYGIDYVIYSYETPIAWLRGDGEWAMPEAGYTPTTKSHKATIRAAIEEYKKKMNNA